MQSRDEAAQLDEIRSRLERDFPGRQADIAAALDQAAAELADAKIRDFVPVLVERSARRQLSA